MVAEAVIPYTQIVLLAFVTAVSADWKKNKKVPLVFIFCQLLPLNVKKWVL